MDPNDDKGDSENYMIGDLLNSELHEEFLESFSVDEPDVKIHEARRSSKERKWGPIFGALFILLFSVCIIYYILGGRYKTELVLIVGFSAFLVIQFSVLLEKVTDYKARSSDVSDRDVICYKLEYAMKEYQNGNLKTVVARLNDLNDLLLLESNQGISNRMKDWTRVYVWKLNNAKDKEKSVERTFDRFAAKLTEDLVDPRGQEINDLVNNIEQTTNNRESGSKRALLDLWSVISSVILSSWGVIFLSILAACTVIFIFNRITIGVAIPGVILAAYQVLSQSEE